MNKDIKISNKKARIMDCDISIEEEQIINYQDKLNNLGSEWIDYYDNQVFLNETTDKEIFRILGLVSSIGSPQVLVDLHHTLQPRPSPYFCLEGPPEYKLYEAYYNQESLEISANTKKRLISIAMYRFYSKYLQTHLTEKGMKHKINSNNMPRRHHTTGTYINEPTAATLTIDDMYDACTNYTSPKPLDREKTKITRQRISRICNEGKRFAKFNDKVYEALGIKGLSDLLPTRSMHSPLGSRVKPDEYVFYYI